MSNGRRIVIADTYYSRFLDSWDLLGVPGDYEAQLARLLEFSFGTSDFYSRAFEQLGWSATDTVVNYPELQRLWCVEHDFPWGDLQSIALEQIRRAEPDVVFLQDLSFFSAENLRYLGDRYLLVSQLSSSMPDLANVRCFDTVFTSFPHYVGRFQDLGVNGVYMPLAFDPIVPERAGPRPADRDLDCIFVGGYGPEWPIGAAVLDAIAAVVPAVRFYGYGFERAPQNIRRVYFGPAWGIDMYRLLSRTRLVLNRHSAAAEGCANNLRMFEATGCGAVLVTERAHNLADYFSEGEVLTYESPEHAVAVVRQALDRPESIPEIAARGQSKTLRAHTWAQRIPRIASVLRQRLAGVVRRPDVS